MWGNWDPTKSSRSHSVGTSLSPMAAASQVGVGVCALADHKGGVSVIAAVGLGVDELAVEGSFELQHMIACKRAGDVVAEW